jgi:hypothetical protein
MKTSIMQPGSIAWSQTWPPWQHGDQECPHPIIAIGSENDGKIAIAPCSSKGSLGRLQIPINTKTPIICPSAFRPKGCLSVEPTWICITDKNGNSNIRMATITNNALIFGTKPIKIRAITILESEDWQRLKHKLLEIIHLF